jgi:cold-inducible RNA-binding protein
MGMAAFCHYRVGLRSNQVAVKLHVGNLAYQTTDSDLRILFSQAGTVSAIDLIVDRDNGQSKGYAFVTMQSQEDAQKAISMLDSFVIHERELKVSIAKPREERPAGAGAHGRSAAPASHAARKHKRRGGNRRY